MTTSNVAFVHLILYNPANMRHELKYLPNGDIHPGFIYDARHGYSVDPKYIDAERVYREMPVRPDYSIVRGVELLGSPQLVRDTKTAANPGYPDNHQLTHLLDEIHYRRNTMPALEGSQIPDSRQDYITGPLEITPFATNAIIDPHILVDYAHAIQFIGAELGELKARDAMIHGMFDGTLKLGEPVDDCTGLAHVTHLRVPCELRSMYYTIRDLDIAGTEIPLTDREGEKIVEYALRGEIQDIGRSVSRLRQIPVKGVLLSPIRVNVRYQDGEAVMARRPHGEFIIAVSYLV